MPAASCSSAASSPDSTCAFSLSLRAIELEFDSFCMSPLEHSAQHIQRCLSAAAASIAADQNQLSAAVCSARTHVQVAAKKLQEAQTAYTKVATAAAAAPNSNIHDCASAARTQRDDLMALAGQMQELAEFLKVFFAICLFQPSLSSEICGHQCFAFCTIVAATRIVLMSLFRKLLLAIRIVPKCQHFLLLLLWQLPN
jgi:hypothetical protein